MKLPDLRSPACFHNALRFSANNNLLAAARQTGHNQRQLCPGDWARCCPLVQPLRRSSPMSLPASILTLPLLAESSGGLPAFAWAILGVVGLILAVILFCELLGMRYIPNSRVGIVEKLWSRRGSVKEGRILAMGGEAG